MVTFLGATTYMSPFCSSASRSHHTETNNINTTIKKTHKCTYQGQKSCISRHRIVCCTWDLQNRQDSSKRVSLETLCSIRHNLREKAYERSRTEMIFIVFHSLINESMKALHDLDRLSYRGLAKPDSNFFDRVGSFK